MDGISVFHFTFSSCVGVLRNGKEGDSKTRRGGRLPLSSPLFIFFLDLKKPEPTSSVFPRQHRVREEYTEAESTLSVENPSSTKRLKHGSTGSLSESQLKLLILCSSRSLPFTLQPHLSPPSPNPATLPFRLPPTYHSKTTTESCIARFFSRPSSPSSPPPPLLPSPFLSNLE